MPRWASLSLNSCVPQTCWSFWQKAENVLMEPVNMRDKYPKHFHQPDFPRTQDPLEAILSNYGLVLINRSNQSKSSCRESVTLGNRSKDRILQWLRKRTNNKYSFSALHQQQGRAPLLQLCYAAVRARYRKTVNWIISHTVYWITKTLEGSFSWGSSQGARLKSSIFTEEKYFAQNSWHFARQKLLIKSPDAVDNTEATEPYRCHFGIQSENFLNEVSVIRERTHTHWWRGKKSPYLSWFCSSRVVRGGRCDGNDGRWDDGGFVVHPGGRVDSLRSRCPGARHSSNWWRLIT